MDGVVQLQGQLVDYTASLFHEGYLNDQFTQLQQLQDESNPDFVVEVVSLFFEDSERLLNELAKALDQQNLDFRRVDSHVHQLKGSSSSIGAQRVQNVCIVFRNFCEEQNVDGCLQCLQQVRQEYSVVKNKLETLFKLEQKLLAARGSIPIDFGMSSSACESSLAGRGKNKRKWTPDEDAKFVEALVRLARDGTHKADNGFKSGFLYVLEKALELKLPGCNIKGDPHIKSRMKT